MKLNNKEFEKWIKILGAEKLIGLHISMKIKLNSEQLENAIKVRNKK